MARRKTISDADLLDGLLAAIDNGGPQELTFAKGSEAVGLSPATLVQRFGTREKMIEAALLRAWDLLGAATASGDEEYTVDPAGAIKLLLHLMPTSEAEHHVADGLLLLREDMRNPTLRARGQAWGKQLAQALGRRLTCDDVKAEQLGWQMASVWQGALIWQAFTQGSTQPVLVENMLKDWCSAA